MEICYNNKTAQTVIHFMHELHNHAASSHVSPSIATPIGLALAELLVIELPMSGEAHGSRLAMQHLYT